MKEVSVGGGPFFGHNFKIARGGSSGSGNGGGGGGGGSCRFAVIAENGLIGDGQRHALGC